jgi:hypothetical protein
LLERWLASVDRHVQYLKLDDAAYAQAEAWPRHERPTRWVVELARTRLLELQASLVRYRAKGDGAFAESLELMSFLTSLLASEHIERFIPLATGKAPTPGSVTGTVEEPRLKPAAAKESSATRQAPPRPAAAKANASNRPASKPPAATNTRAATRPAPAPATVAQPVRELTPAEQQLVRTVIADAVRFLEWGTEWPALASKIAHLAGRPDEDLVRTILRAHRDTIQQRSKRRVD